MAAPSTPINVYAQQGNGQILLTWEISAGATSYKVYRSLDNVTFTLLTSPVINNYLDTAVTVGVQYWYTVSADNGAESPQSDSVWEIPVVDGTLALAQIRLQSQQRADRVNSDFVTMPEWNNYINQSLFELYDLIETTYEDYYLAVPLEFTTNGDQFYPLPNGINNSGALPFYKLVGVDMSLDNSQNAKVTIQKFNFINRNRYVFPNIQSTYMGVFNLQYRVMGDSLMFIPAPSAGQVMTLWYTPRMRRLLRDTDISDGVNGWLEYIIVDTAIKALQKEESDVSVLMAQKAALIDRIQAAAINRDVSEPDTISDTRGWGTGGRGGWGGNGTSGGY